MNKSTKVLSVERLQALYEKIVLNMNEALWMGDKEEKTVYANPKFCDMVGYKLYEMIGEKSYKFWDTSSKKTVKNENEAKRKHGMNSSYEGNLLTKKGRKIPVKVNGTYLPDGGTIGIITDLREMKEYYERLQELERIINDSHAITILWRNTDDRPIEFISENIKRFGYDAQDFYEGKIAYLDIIHEDDLKRVLLESFEHDVGGDKEFIQEYRILTKSGEVRWVNDHTFIRKDQNGVITFHEGIVLDITERKKAESKVFEMYKYLGVINRKVSILLNLNKNDMKENRKEVLNLITHSAHNISDSNFCLLYFLNKEKKCFCLVSHSGDISEKNLKTISKLKPNYNKQIVNMLKNHKRVQGLSKNYDLGKLNMDNKMKYFIMLPLMHHDELIGMSLLGYEDRIEVTTQELDFFDLFAIQIANMMAQIDKNKC